MKFNRTYIFIATSSVALAMLLLIQINWIIQTAKVKEELFNEKASMVLSRTTQELCSDKETCMNMENCGFVDGKSGCKLDLGKNEIHKIDSLLKKFMALYHFHLDYSFEVIPPNKVFIEKEVRGWSDNIFKTRLEEVFNNNGLELKLIFPDKKQYILEEMGPMFICSILLILVVLILFWRTIWSLLKEKKISEHTTDFLNNMTHEFKTPLTNIGLAGKMILKDTTINPEEKLKHYTGIILEENEKLRLQVEQVLSMTALERGEIPLNKINLDFHQLINASLKCILIQIENRKGNLILNLNAEQHTIFGDKNHLTNAICNLIDNAIKYSAEKPEIKIQTFNKDEKLIFMISDNGIGIDKEYLKKVFEKYFRVPTGNLHDVKGFGLGLAYVKKIIELHHGTVELTSEKVKGSTFIISFPIVNE